MVLTLYWGLHLPHWTSLASMQQQVKKPDTSEIKHTTTPASRLFLNHSMGLGAGGGLVFAHRTPIAHWRDLQTKELGSLTNSEHQARHMNTLSWE